MALEFIVMLVFMLAGFAMLFFMMQRNKPTDDLVAIVRLLQQSSAADRSTLLSSLQKNTSDLNQRLDHAAHIIGQLQRHVGELSEIGRGIQDVREFLRSPKLRGTLGEYALYDLLARILPPTGFARQHAFRSGTIVDAIVITNNGTVPIDAKFPLEQFRAYIAATADTVRNKHKRAFINDVKKHIRAIASRYIVTDEGTVDFALMYIPSETVYYEIAKSPDLFDFAEKERVLPVSPSTLYAYLRTILMSLEGQKIEKQARKILQALRAMHHDYEQTEQSFDTLQRHITNAFNTTTTTRTLFIKLGTSIGSVHDIKD
jgi:DNA recombination protein RmuC